MTRETKSDGFAPRQSDQNAAWEHESKPLLSHIPTRLMIWMLVILAGIITMQYFFGDGQGW